MKKLIILSLIAVLLWLGFKYSANNFHSVVANKFYRSAQLDSQTLADIISEYNIATVVNLRGPNLSSEWYHQEKQQSAELGVKHIDLRLSPYGLPKINQVKELVEILQYQTKPILFHCKRGADRAGLASVIALLLEQQQNIFEIEDQVSWRYRALEDNSTGKLFFAQYYAWLDSHNSLSTPEVFRHWLDHEYLDDQGNMLYTFETVNDMVVANMEDEGTRAPVINIDRKDYQQLTISGWTIDFIGKTVPQKVSILLDQRPMKNMRIKQPRPDVAKAFGDLKFSQAGWSATELMNNLANNCYDVQLQFTGVNNRIWTSKVMVEICIRS